MSIGQRAIRSALNEEGQLQHWDTALLAQSSLLAHRFCVLIPMSSILQLAGYAFVLYVGWRLLRSTFYKSPLDNVPGIANDSLIAGKPSEPHDEFH